jgi:DtxR family Mn-dependent transcriptional regulator
MMKRLAARGSVTYEPYSGVRLTVEGERQALRVVRRHRLLERLLTDVLKLPWDDVHEQACRLEHSVSPQMEAKIEEALGGAETCPHGHPIPTADGRVAEESALPLTDLDAGRRARIVRIALEAADFLRYLASLGLLPDVEITLETKAPFDGPLMVRVGGAHYALGRDVAGAILVAPA